MKNRYFIPVNGNPVEVNRETYLEYYRPVWRTRYLARKNGECRCPKTHIASCDGVCPGCRYYTGCRKVSISEPLDEDGTLEDMLFDDSAGPEDIFIEKELLSALYEELQRLDGESRLICGLLAEGRTEREIAAAVRKSQSTVHSRKSRILSALRDKLKDYYL